MQSLLKELHEERVSRSLKQAVFEYKNIKVTYLEKPGMALGSQMWGGAFELARHIIDHTEYFEDKKILEIGAGLGLPSVVASHFGQVTCTDKSDVFDLMTENIKLNTSSVETLDYHWGDQSLGEFDVVMGADIVYFDETFEPLYKTLLANTKYGSLFVLAYQPRVPNEVDFFMTLSQSFTEVRAYENDIITVYHFLRDKN